MPAILDETSSLLFDQAGPGTVAGLAENQADLDGYLFGGGAGRITIEQVAVDAPAAVTQDTPMVLADGQAFGIDAMGSRTVTITGHVLDTGDPQGVFGDYAALVAAWNNPAVRLTPRAVSVLRYRFPGLAGTWRMYGRGRSIAPVLYNKGIDLIGFTAAFSTADPLFYDDTEQQVSLSLAWADPGGGVAPPVAPPVLLAAPGGPGPGVAVNAGPEATWPVIAFTGPATNPLLAYTDLALSIGLRGTLTEGQQVIADTRPWARSVTSPTGGSFAGLLTGNRLADLALPPGATALSYSGQDPTGRSSCTVAWRNASQIFAVPDGGSS